MNVFIYFLCFGIGVCLSCILFKILHPSFGTLKIDVTDPEDVKMRLVIDKDIDSAHERSVTLKIEKTSLSHK